MKRFYFLWLILIAFVFASCGTSNKFASSFGKRRYTKGYYVDAPSAIKSHSTVNSFGNHISHHVEIHAPLIAANPKPSIIENGAPARTTNHSIVKNVHASVNSVTHLTIPAKVETLPVNNDDDKKNNKYKSTGQTNYWAIIGFIFCAIGVTLLSINAGGITVLSGFILGLGVVACVYSLFLTKIYWSWLAIIGLSIVVIMCVLLFL